MDVEDLLCGEGDIERHRYLEPLEFLVGDLLGDSERAREWEWEWEWEWWEWGEFGVGDGDKEIDFFLESLGEFELKLEVLFEGREEKVGNLREEEHGEVDDVDVKDLFCFGEGDSVLFEKSGVKFKFRVFESSPESSESGGDWLSSFSEIGSLIGCGEFEFKFLVAVLVVKPNFCKKFETKDSINAWTKGQFYYLSI